MHLLGYGKRSFYKEHVIITCTKNLLWESLIERVSFSFFFFCISQVLCMYLLSIILLYPIISLCLCLTTFISTSIISINFLLSLHVDVICIPDTLLMNDWTTTSHHEKWLLPYSTFWHMYWSKKKKNWSKDIFLSVFSTLF